MRNPKDAAGKSSRHAQWLTPPALAAHWGVDPAKVIGWIVAGELAAINAATSLSAARPRYRISQQAIADFERRRAVTPPPPQTTRRKQKRTGEIKEFF
jgi:hypothetical protein